jgi:hypothetical protein
MQLTSQLNTAINSRKKVIVKKSKDSDDDSSSDQSESDWNLDD